MDVINDKTRTMKKHLGMPRSSRSSDRDGDDDSHASMTMD